MNDSVKDLGASAAKAVPAVGANWWFWFSTHDINWFVALATLVYISLQVYVLVRDKVVKHTAGAA